MNPINLREWEVRAIQSGATLLVRPIKPQPPEGSRLTAGDYWPTTLDAMGWEKPGKEQYGFWNQGGEWAVKSPFGGPGEILAHKKSGLRLTVKSVRVMRVQELSEADAIKAGFRRVLGESVKIHGRHAGMATKSARSAFVGQFVADHGPDAWDRNDWVAVCEFVIERDGKAVGK